MSCPRCGQVLMKDGDFHGDFFRCIYCGYYKDIMKKIVIPDSVKGHFTPFGRRKKYERRNGREWNSLT